MHRKAKDLGRITGIAVRIRYMDYKGKVLKEVTQNIPVEGNYDYETDTLTYIPEPLEGIPP